MQAERYGEAPYLLCGPRGAGPFRPEAARIRGRRNRSIAEICVNMRRFAERIRNTRLLAIHRAEFDAFHSRLWDEYVSENPRLIEKLCSASGIADTGEERGAPSVARELWRIRTEVLAGLANSREAA